jgi:hypothetical protein
MTDPHTETIIVCKENHEEIHNVEERKREGEGEREEREKREKREKRERREREERGGTWHPPAEKILRYFSDVAAAPHSLPTANVMI